MIYTVTLSPALDRSIGPEDERIDPGGKGLNVVKTLNALGYKAIAVCFAAGKTGETLYRLAANAQIELLPVPTPGETRVNLKLFDGETITEPKLRMVDEAEQLIRDLGFPQVRVRIHGDLARIEVEPERVPELLAEPNRTAIAEGLKRAGFRYVTADLSGYRTGSMNEVLDRKAVSAGST